jgi:methylisocitrate lyase
MEAERPLQLAGTINAYCALLAERAGFRALYLSGAGVANASFGLPDLGLTTLTNVCEDLRRITGATQLPVLVDADTGWGPAAPAIARAIRELERAGAAGCHIEDQAHAKRCGHRPGKQLVSAEEMSDRVQAAVAGRRDPASVIIARTDALAAEGVAATLQRARRYVDAGADAIFLEAATTLDDYRRFTAELPVPILANSTEFGVTPLFTVDELRDAGVRMVLYPLTAFRAMSAAAQRVYHTLRAEGTQMNLLDRMQTRAELYEVLRYLEVERQFDELSAGKEGS